MLCTTSRDNLELFRAEFANLLHGMWTLMKCVYTTFHPEIEFKSKQWKHSSSQASRKSLVCSVNNQNDGYNLTEIPRAYCSRIFYRKSCPSLENDMLPLFIACEMPTRLNYMECIAKGSLATKTTCLHTVLVWQWLLSIPAAFLCFKTNHTSRISHCQTFS